MHCVFGRSGQNRVRNSPRKDTSRRRVVRFRNHQESEISSLELSMALEPEAILHCLDEVESGLFEAADDNDCQRFHRNSQLTAVLLLLLRTSSLLRSMLLLVQYRDLVDGFHLVARGFEETWNL